MRGLDYNPARFQAALFIVGVDGEGLRQVTDWMTSESERTSWSPDGSTILFARDGALWTVHPDGSGLAELRPTDWSVSDALFEGDWSPDRFLPVGLPELLVKDLVLLDPWEGAFGEVFQHPAW